jgi:imidazolonepropionase
MRAELLVSKVSCLITCDPAREGLGEIVDGSVAFSGGRVSWVGPAAHAPDADAVIDGAGLIGLPGLVDPHTHAIWGGSRADEFRRRLAGERYTAILEAGGGILSTVAATRAADEDALIRHARARLQGFLARGVTTVEIKSGYGLCPEVEARMLRAARALGDTVRVVPTFLGAHAIPAEHRSRRDAYVRQILEEQLPSCAPLAEAVDVYCDVGAFSLDESVAILEAGRALGLRVRAHAEQVAYTGIAAAAARLGATCVDHLERLDDAGVAALAEHGTVAVLLPGAQLYLRDVTPPVAALRAAGVPLAVGTDLNPGSSPVHDLWAAATLACVLQGLSVEEAVLGITRNAGRALGRPELGWLGAGSAGDMALFAPPPGEPAQVATLVQQLGLPRAVAVIREGSPALAGRRSAFV